MSDMLCTLSRSMSHSRNNVPSLIYRKRQEPQSVHLEETENAASYTVVSVSLSSLSCVCEIRSWDDFLRWHLPILPSTKDFLHLQWPLVHHYPGVPCAGSQSPSHSARHTGEVGECEPSDELLLAADNIAKTQNWCLPLCLLGGFLKVFQRSDLIVPTISPLCIENNLNSVISLSIRGCSGCLE